MKLGKDFWLVMKIIVTILDALRKLFNESDDKAIEYKKKIASLMAEAAEAQIQFSLMNIPKGLDELAIQGQGGRS